jgi:hypothetical protein
VTFGIIQDSPSPFGLNQAILGERRLRRRKKSLHQVGIGAARNVEASFVACRGFTAYNLRREFSPIFSRRLQWQRTLGLRVVQSVGHLNAAHNSSWRRHHM